MFFLIFEDSAVSFIFLAPDLLNFLPAPVVNTGFDPERRTDIPSVLASTSVATAARILKERTSCETEIFLKTKAVLR
jgi:hypothetical protein